MDTAEIISEIDAQISRLQQARTLLTGSAASKTDTAQPKGRKGTLSASGRAKIGDAQRARWAKARAGKKKR